MRTLPWREGTTPLMLAPMQGLTNRGQRAVFGRLVKPDVLFTEFVKVRPGARQLISPSDVAEAAESVPGIPLVVQLIGKAGPGLIEAAEALIDQGVEHINLNMGCPFGRMASHLAGGGMFRDACGVAPMLETLRRLVPGSLSVKTRLGTDDPRGLFALLPIFEDAGVDFIAVHARTVAQKYRGVADHRITAELVERTALPLIANGDIDRVDVARRVLDSTGAAGLMLGRGAISDPLLFERIRGAAPEAPDPETRRVEIRAYLGALLDEYVEMYCGDAQILKRLNDSLRLIEGDEHRRWLKGLRKAKSVAQLREQLDP